MTDIVTTLAGLGLAFHAGINVRPLIAKMLRPWQV